jgi:CHAT domain
MSTMQWKVAEPDQLEVSVARARGFLFAGLGRGYVASKRLKSAMLQGDLATWRRTRHADFWQLGIRADSEWIRQVTDITLPLFVRPAGNRDLAGLRLRAPLAAPRFAGGPAELRRLLMHPGYEDAIREESFVSGVASFVADLSRAAGWGNQPALSWPLNIVAHPDLLAELSNAHAVLRGLAWLRHGPGHRPDRETGTRVQVEVVNFDEEAFRGEALALRFLCNGRTPRTLSGRLTFERLQEIEPAVFFRLNGMPLGERLSGFIYELAHNHPVDVAAWAAVRWEPPARRLAPLVVAPLNFLRRARVSDVIPALQARLRRLHHEFILPVAPDALRGLGSSFLQEPAGIRVARFADLLGDVDRLSWDREADTGTSLVAVRHEVEQLERLPAPQALPAQSRSPAPARAAPAPPTPAGFATVPAPPLAATFSTAPPPGWGDTTPSGGAAFGSVTPIVVPEEFITPPPVPPRYTDVTIFDPDARVHGQLEPFTALITYTLDVAIRGSRQGITRDRSDQPAIPMPPQADTVSVWAVISDETEGEPEIAQQLFSFDRHFGELRLPPAGDSEGSARFQFTAHPGRIALNRPREEVCPRIGIRLYHKLNLIDHVQLDLRYADAAAAGAAAAGTMAAGTTAARAGAMGQSAAIQVVFKHPGGAAASLEPPNASSAARALTISISKADGQPDQYRFAVAACSTDRPDEPAISGTKKLSLDVLNDFVARFRDLMLPTVFGAALGQVSLPGNDRDELLKNVSALGTEIVTRLFDYSPGGDFFELGAMVRDVLPDKSIVQISLNDDSKDFVFPWAALTVKPDADPDAAIDARNLWGYRFIIEVKRRGDGMPAAAGTRPPGPARLAYARWNFKNEPAHYAALSALAVRAQIPVQWVDPIIETRADLVSILLGGGGEMVYVYAHGHAAAPNTPLGLRYRDNAQQQIKELKQRMKSDPLLSSDDPDWKDVEEHFLKLTRAGAETSLTLSRSEVVLSNLLVALGGGRQKLVDAPIVFLNTCESAQIWNAVDGSFVGFFLDRGARAVVGTECTVPVVLADEFGREALAHLFSGDTVGEAVFKARVALLASSNNPLGLCYCIYGSSDAHLGPDLAA